MSHLRGDKHTPNSYGGPNQDLPSQVGQRLIGWRTTRLRLHRWTVAAPREGCRTYLCLPFSVRPRAGSASRRRSIRCVSLPPRRSSAATRRFLSLLPSLRPRIQRNLLLPNSFRRIFLRISGRFHRPRFHSPRSASLPLRSPSITHQFFSLSLSGFRRRKDCQFGHSSPAQSIPMDRSRSSRFQTSIRFF